MLKIEDISVSYGSAIAVQSAAVDVEAGEWAALVGANGAGKTSTLKATMGLIPHRGRVWLGGVDLTRLDPWERQRAGLGYVPEGRQLFRTMTVEENLRVGAYNRSATQLGRANALVAELFPRLAERRHQIAATLSGGEQQMLAIGRALMGEPKVLLIDEVSWGLMPKLVAEVLEKLTKLNRAGLAILQVEQNARLVLRYAHRAYVMATGRIVLTGASEDVARDARTLESYVG